MLQIATTYNAIKSVPKCMMGPLTGGPQCHVDDNIIPCRSCSHHLFNFPIDFKVGLSNVAWYRFCLCHVTNYIPVSLSKGSMLLVHFKKSPCRPVEFRGQGPFFSPDPWHSGATCPTDDTFRPVKMSATVGGTSEVTGSLPSGVQNLNLASDIVLILATQ